MATEAALGAGIALGMIVLVLLIIGLAIASLVFWILMIVDCAQRKLPDGERIAWILVLIFTGVLGAVIYYFVVKRKKR